MVASQHPDPEQQTFADAQDLVQRERSRKRKLLLSAAGVVVLDVVFRSVAQ